MRQRLQYLYLEMKKTIGMFPRMLLQAILLMVIISVIAFCGIKSMDRDSLAVNVDIGVVVREDNTMTRMALGYVENMESVSQICSFTQMSEEDGFAQLERGEVAALVILPEQLVEGIMNGQNPAVDVIFPRNARLEAMLFRELTESGSGLLRVAQAQIYGAGDTAAEYGLTDRLSVIYTEIDSYNLAFALDRLAMYDEETVSVTGRMSVLQYYVAAGVVMFLLLAGMAAYPVMQQEPPAVQRQLMRQGTGMMWQCFCRWLCGFVCMGMLSGAAWILFKIAGVLAPDAAESVNAALISGRNRGSVGMQAVMIVLIVITAATFIYMMYSFAGSRTSGIMLIFLCSVLMIYLSGGFIPSALMPQSMQVIGDKLPTAYMIRAFGGLLAGYGDGVPAPCMMGMCAYTVVFGAAGYIIRWRRER